MRIALAQVDLHIGNFQYNTRQIIQSIEQAREQGADLVVFSELAVCGYPARDLLLSDDFISHCQRSIHQIASHCKGIAAVVGGPDLNTSPRGKRLYNAAFFMELGKVTHVYHKGLLPDYDVFDEYRYFEPSLHFKTIPFMGKKIALTICEDIWNLGHQPLYAFNPMDHLVEEKPELMVNISASPFSWNRTLERLQMVSENASRYRLPMFYVNQFGAHTELLFDGGTAVFNPAGRLVDVFEPFRPGLRLYELDQVLAHPGVPLADEISNQEKNRLIYEALVLGIKEYFGKTGLKKAILGLSGGLDSALVLALAVKALGKENVWAVLLPGPYSSQHSVEDALQMARALEVQHDIISINSTVEVLNQSLDPWFANSPQGIAEENLQARARAIILMGLSNKFGHMLLNTSNKSEIAVGYGTLYGDMCGGLSVIGDIYKTQAYELSHYINSMDQVIPQNILEKAPSAELKPDQKDSDSLPEYHVLDPILFCYIEKQMSPEQIIRKGHDAAVVNRVIPLVNANEYKRQQSAPVLRVSSKSFGPGRQFPIVAKY